VRGGILQGKKAAFPSYLWKKHRGRGPLEKTSGFFKTQPRTKKGKKKTIRAARKKPSAIPLLQDIVSGWEREAGEPNPQKSVGKTISREKTSKRKERVRAGEKRVQRVFSFWAGEGERSRAKVRKKKKEKNSTDG